MASVALAALFDGLSQVLVEKAAPTHVAPDVAVDRLVTYGKACFDGPCSRYLLRAQVVEQLRAHILPLLVAEPCVDPRGASARHGASVRLAWSVTVIGGYAVTSHLSPNRAAVSPHALGNLAAVESFLAEGGYDYPVLQGELGIRHVVVPDLGREERAAVSQTTRFIPGGRVAVSL